MRYLLNCFLLVVPLLVFNVALADRLPTAYQSPRWDDVPAWVALPENILRVGTMLLTLLLPISFAGPLQRIGGMLYVVGVVTYIATWTVQIVRPHAAWSTGALGFLAPAYTPALWLTGIGLIGIRPVIAPARHLQWIFLGLAVAFLASHNLHALLVYRRGGAN